MERNDVQQAIVELRRRLGMTQQALAVHLGK
jgi:DNA-binding XRE family transcriptional regulator